MGTEHVVVGMSGGVDSSVAAGLLVEAGYQVTGVMLRLWSEPGEGMPNRCCAPDAVAQARRVAAILGIPFYVLDIQEVFRKTVVESFLDGYQAGITPNPCLICNHDIRWGILLDHARALGASRMATGHYARLQASSNVGTQLLQACDLSKDQSYVLSALNQDQLSATLLPVGGYRKQEVRALAQKFGLPVASRPDSQDLCFISDGNYRRFIRRHRDCAIIPGEITDQNGKVVGTHSGLVDYTIGQRKGLGISSSHPWYVTAINVHRNQLVVGQAHELGEALLRADHLNWIAESPPEMPFEAQVKIRYRSALHGAMITQSDQPGSIVIRFNERIRDITPGQAAVIYSGEVCLGGGIITPTI